MAESNSQATRCPCGFFGSAQTLGLCSKCYNEREQSRAQLAVDASRSTTSPELRGVVDRESTGFQTDDAPPTPPASTHVATSDGASDDVAAGLMPVSSADTSCSQQEQDGSASTDRGSSDAGCDATTDATQQRGVKRKYDELDVSSEQEQQVGGGEAAGGDVGQGMPPPPPPAQKNKKRCHLCNCRLELAVREIGKCKCEYVFCALHRLPEQHACTFDHKAYGRAEARAKMVPFRKNVGTSLKRLDPSDS